MKYRPVIIEGVMNRVLYEIARVHQNALQESWGPGWGDDDDKSLYVPLTIGSITVKIERHESAGCDLMSIVFEGNEVSTWLDSKREFYHAHVPDQWDNATFIDWADRIFQELEALDRVTMDRLHGYPVSLKKKQ